MVRIKEAPNGVTVEGAAFQETFRSRLKALMAAHAVALGEATATGIAVVIAAPDDWGAPVIVEPCARLAAQFP